MTSSPTTRRATAQSTSRSRRATRAPVPRSTASRSCFASRRRRSPGRLRAKSPCTLPRDPGYRPSPPRREPRSSATAGPAGRSRGARYDRAHVYGLFYLLALLLWERWYMGRLTLEPFRRAKVRRRARHALAVNPAEFDSRVELARDALARGRPAAALAMTEPIVARADGAAEVLRL